MSQLPYERCSAQGVVHHRACPTYQTTTNAENIVTQSEALEIAMKLKESPIGETAVEMNQIHTQLANIMLQLQDIKKAKEDHDDLWCTPCHADGHTKDTCPTFQNYFLSGAPNPLSCASIPLCRICQVYGHRHENCKYMQKMVTKTKSLYCTFC